MTRYEHLMIIAMEECDEVSQRISKAARFGMEQVQDNAHANPESLTNRERIYMEFYDLRATLGMLGIDAWERSDLSRQMEIRKEARVNEYLKRSAMFGTLDTSDGSTEATRK